MIFFATLFTMNIGEAQGRLNKSGKILIASAKVIEFIDAAVTALNLLLKPIWSKHFISCSSVVLIGNS